nr:MAG: replication associated protein [Arizlama virus]
MAQNKRSRAWAWTIVRRDEDDGLLPQLPVFKDIVIYYKYQLERCPETGRLHYQGCCRLKESVTMSTVKLAIGVPHAHLEIAKSWKDLVVYCGKAESRVDGPWEKGEPKKQGERNDIKAAFGLVQEVGGMKRVADEMPNVFIKYHKGLEAYRALALPSMRREDLKVYVLYGTTGCGKTHKVHELFPDVYTVFDTKSPWFDGYRGQDAILLDDFGGGVDQCSMNINFLKRVLDKYPIDVPIKGGSVGLRATKIFITTNIPFELWYPKANGTCKEALWRRITDWVEYHRVEDRARWQRKYQEDNDAGPVQAPALVRQDAQAPPVPEPGSAAAAAASIDVVGVDYFDFDAPLL